MPKVTAEHEQRRRAQILAAAMACFARSGYRATSMEDIVRESGLSVGAIYSYFPSKEEIFLALADQRTEQTLGALRAIFDEPGPMEDHMRRAVDFLFDQMADDLIPYARVSLEFSTEAARSEPLQARHAERCTAIRQFVERLVGEAQRAGAIRAEVDVFAASELVMALSDGILMHHVSCVQPVPLDALRNAYLAFVNFGLADPAHPFLGPPAVRQGGDPAPLRRKP